MKKILLIVAVTAISAVFFHFAIKNNSAEAGFPGSTIDTSWLPNCKVQTYQDKFLYGQGKHCLDNVNLYGYYFIPKDQIPGIVPNWSTNMLDIFNKIKDFYETQFDNKLKITISNTPVIVYGDKSAEEYVAASVIQEVKTKTGYTNTGPAWDIRMIYIHTGYNNKSIQGVVGAAGGEDGSGTAPTNVAAWLNSDSLGAITKYGTDYNGYTGSVHEFGHSLGIPHPWEEEVNKDSSGNVLDPSYGNNEMGSIMSYGGQRWPDAFIRQTVKNRMIIPVVQTPTPTPTLSPTPTPTPTCYWWEGQCQPTPIPTPAPTPPPTTSAMEIIRFDGDPMVYLVQGSKIKWVPNPDVFDSLGLNWTSVEVVPISQKADFQRAKLLRAENDEKVFYITEGGLKRHIPNVETFNSYDNSWQDVVVVKDFELSAISDNQLIRQSGDSKVYKLENGQKRWIKTADVFNRLGLNWAQIAPVNGTELNSYPLGAPIE